MAATVIPKLSAVADSNHANYDWHFYKDKYRMATVSSLSAAAALETTIRAQGPKAVMMYSQIPSLVRSLRAAGITEIPATGLTIDAINDALRPLVDWTPIRKMELKIALRAAGAIDPRCN